MPATRSRATPARVNRSNKRLLDLGRDAGPGVLDGDAHLATVDQRADEHRRLPVAERVRDEVGDDVVEDRGIDDGDSPGRSPRRERRRAREPAATATTSSSRWRRSSSCGLTSTASASRRERSSSCSTSAAMRAVCCSSASRSSSCCARVELVSEMVERLHEPVHRRDRSPQLVRGKRDEVRHQLVRTLEREPRLVLLLEQANAVEGDPRQRRDGMQRPQLVLTEERRVGRRPDVQDDAGLLDPHRVDAAGLLRHQLLREDVAVGVDRCRPPERRRAPRPGRARAAQPRCASSRASSGCGSPPAAAAAPTPARRAGRTVAARGRAGRRLPLRSASSCTTTAPTRVLGRREGRADDRDRQCRRGEREHPHADPRDRGLPPARPPEPRVITTTESNVQCTRKATT